MEKEGVPEGFCGFCEICHKPGHVQHFPGAVPYTGTWCDDCFIKVARKQQIKGALVIVAIISIISILITIFK